MREGLYELKFHPPLRERHGLVTLQSGHILGGDIKFAVNMRRLAP
jgi:hypothetical protein